MCSLFERRLKSYVVMMLSVGFWRWRCEIPHEDIVGVVVVVGAKERREI